MTLRVAISLSAIAALSPVAQAQNTTAGPPQLQEGPWTGKAALGYLATSGNTESSSLNSSFKISYATDKWTHTVDMSAINATEDEETTAEAYSAGWKTEYNLTPRDFLFGRVIWRKDRFSGYDQQLSESIGYGRRLIDTGVHFLNAEIGAGARQSDLADGTTESETILRGSLSYRWQFSENAQFTQDLATESGAENTYLESVTALKATLIGDLSLVASYTIKSNSDVPVGSEKTDTFTALALEYAF